MSRFRRLIVLLTICVLGFQAGATAAHMHFMPMPAMNDQVMVSNHGTPSDDGHHDICCASAESCFPAAITTGMVQSVTQLAPALALPLSVDSLPKPRPDRLLRPPRLLG